MNPEMHLLKVGDLYHPGRTRWPERPEYNFRAGQHELKLFLNRPTAEEIASVTSGHAHFAFDVEGDAIFFLYRFEPNIPWGDSTFSIHLVPSEERILPAVEDLDEQRIIEWLCAHHNYDCLGDLCMGRGLVGRNAYLHGRRFVGTELNAKRLAVLVDFIVTEEGKIVA